MVDFLKSNMLALRQWKIPAEHRGEFLALADRCEYFLTKLEEKEIPKDRWRPGGLQCRR